MTDQDTTGGDGGTGSTATPSRAGLASRRAFPVLAAVVLVAGLSLLGVFGWRYLDAREDQRIAGERDRAVGVATQVLVNAYSFDFRTVDDSLRQLQDASTGDFLEQQKQWAPDVRARVVEQKAVTRASVSNAAPEAFDADAGTASVLLVFTAESQREKQPSITGRQAAKVDLLRVEDAWKVSGLTPVGVIVPVGDSSASVAELGGVPATPTPVPSSPAGGTTTVPTSGR